MGMTSALKLAQSLQLAETVVSIELMSAVRGLDLRGDVTTGSLEEARHSFRESVPAWTEDCVLSIPMQQAAEFVSAGGFRERVVREVAGVGL
jgi:histidine ammonia-lyase